MDANVLDHHKENIKPLHGGRAVLKLGLALTEGRHRAKLAKQREGFESSLISDELDDPLQAYIDYIEWIHNHYPQGNNVDSGLLKLLEKCTSNFRDTPYYKNDPRYLKIWLEYAGYSDLPRDVFVYLAKKEIGVQLALFYEEFARFLEKKGLIADARQVYEIGIERGARPQPRLSRNFKQFQGRVNLHESSGQSNILSLLTQRKLSASPVTDAPTSKRQRVLVFKDESSPTLKETVFAKDPEAKLGTVAMARKENSVSATPWAGQVHRQKIDTEKQPAKFQVFRDPENGPEPTKSEFEVVAGNDGYCSIVKQPGKPVEKVFVNMDLVYPSTNEEYCFAEIYAFSKKFNSNSSVAPAPQSPEREQNQTFTIPLRDEDTLQHPKSPTLTMFSRMTTKEVLGMFNDAAHNFQLDDESTKGFEDSTNYDGFVTETIPMRRQDNQSHRATPSRNQSAPEEASSPFLDRPLGKQ